MEFKDFKQGVSYRPLGHNSLLVELLPSSKLDIQGQFQLFVLKGSVSILGFDVITSHEVISVYSPKGHYALLSLESVSTIGIRNEPELRAFLQTHGETSYPFSIDELKTMEGTVVVLLGMDNRWCEGIRKYCLDGANLVGPKLEGLNIERIPNMNTMICKLGFRFLSDRMSEQKRTFDLPGEWAAILNSILSTSTTKAAIATFGGKGVGKSTFNRWVVNQLLSKFRSGPILFVDLDVGQPELSPPGIISVHQLTRPLLGPNFTHLQQPLKSFYLGTVNVSDDPETYINAMRELGRFIQTDDTLRNRHIVLNTMGFCTGLGVQLAVEAIRIFQPFSVVQIRSNHKKLCFPFLLTSHNVSVFRSNTTKSPSQLTFNNQRQNGVQNPVNHRLYEFASVCSSTETSDTIPSAPQGGSSPRFLREIVMISYFAGEIGGDLLGTRPRVLSMDKVAFGSKSTNFSDTQILEVINGNLVALCGYPTQNLPNVMQKCEACTVLRWDRASLSKQPIEFFGYGIVRGIDIKEKKLFLLTPLEEEVLASSVNCILAAGTIGLPSSFNAVKPNLGPSTPRVQVQPSVLGNRLNNPSKRTFVPNRTTRNVLNNALL